MISRGYSVTDCQLYGWKWVLIYAIVGIAFAALAYLVYRRRASETAGDLITVRWAAVLFRFGVGLCAALTLGFFIYSLFYYEMLADHRHDSMVALTFCMMLMGLVGYFSAEMLLKKTIHVLRTAACPRHSMAQQCGRAPTHWRVRSMGKKRFSCIRLNSTYTAQT